MWPQEGQKAGHGARPVTKLPQRQGVGKGSAAFGGGTRRSPSRAGHNCPQRRTGTQALPGQESHRPVGDGRVGQVEIQDSGAALGNVPH